MQQSGVDCSEIMLFVSRLSKYISQSFNILSTYIKYLIHGADNYMINNNEI